MASLRAKSGVKIGVLPNLYHLWMLSFVLNTTEYVTTSENCRLAQKPLTSVSQTRLLGCMAETTLCPSFAFTFRPFTVSA